MVGDVSDGMKGIGLTGDGVNGCDAALGVLGERGQISGIERGVMGCVGSIFWEGNGVIGCDGCTGNGAIGCVVCTGNDAIGGSACTGAGAPDAGSTGAASSAGAEKKSSAVTASSRSSPRGADKLDNTCSVVFSASTVVSFAITGGIGVGCKTAGGNNGFRRRERATFSSSAGLGLGCGVANGISFIGAD